MGVKYSFVLVVAAVFLFGIGAANKDWNGTYPNYNWAWNHNSSTSGGGFWWAGRNRPYKPNMTSNRIVVGGSDNTWHFGFNYTDWAIKNGPFYVNDKLVFKYDPPNDTTFPHSVYLLPNFWSFHSCDLRFAKKIGEVDQGGGRGFEFELKRWQPYYFACGEHNGIHCKDGLMKFSVWPLIRWNY